MLMASIVASMMMGGFLLTVTGESDDDLAVDQDEGEGHDLYADDGAEDVGGVDGWGDLLSDLMEDDALLGGPEAVNAAAGSAAEVGHALPSEAELADLSDEDLLAALDEALEADEFEDDFADLDPDGVAAAELVEPIWTEDGTEIVVDDFVPGEDELILSFDENGEAPQIDLFGDPSGNALVFADGHLAFKVMGGDGLVIPEDVKLVAEGDEMPLAETAPA